MNAIIYMFLFFFNAQILAGDQFAVVLCFPFWSYIPIVFSVTEGRIVFELYKKYQNLRLRLMWEEWG